MKNLPLVEMLYLLVRLFVLCLVLHISDVLVVRYHEEYPFAILVLSLLTVAFIFVYSLNMLRIMLQINKKYFK